MMKRLLLTLALLAGSVAPAYAALSLANLGQHNVPGNATNILTTATNACAAGSLIVVQASYGTLADPLSSVVDSAGNTYQTPIDVISGTSIGSAWAYAINTSSNLPVGGTITATFAGANANAIQAVCIGGADTSTPLDKSNNTAQGTGTTSASTVSTGTLSNTAEVVLGTLANPTAPGTVTCGGSFTKIAFNGTPSVNLCYQIVASSSSVSFAPTWVNSVNYVTDLISFQAPGGGGPTGPPAGSLGLLGVGK